MNQSAMVGDKEYAELNLTNRTLWKLIVLFYAWIVAQIMHLGQVRRTGDRTVEHAQAVASLTRAMGGSVWAEACALFHDVVEDSKHWLKRMIAVMLVLLAGPVIAPMVFMLTKWSGSDEQYLNQILSSLKQLTRFFFWLPWLRWIFGEVMIVKVSDKYTCLKTPFMRSPEKERILLESVLPGGSFAHFIEAGRQYVRPNLLTAYDYRTAVIQSIAERRLCELNAN